MKILYFIVNGNLTFVALLCILGALTHPKISIFRLTLCSIVLPVLAIVLDRIVFETEVYPVNVTGIILLILLNTVYQLLIIYKCEI